MLNTSYYIDTLNNNNNNNNDCMLVTLIAVSGLNCKDEALRSRNERM